MRPPPLLALILLAACGGIPRDPDGTLDRIRRDGVMRVGVVDDAAPAGAARASALVAALERATGARTTRRGDALEPLLVGLEAGELDLVVGGRFAGDSPWKTRVTLGPPLAPATPAGALTGHAVTRNGENAWIMLVQREARGLARR